MATLRNTLPGEIWKPLCGYEARYEISTLGRIWSLRSGVIMGRCFNAKGYERIGLTDDSGASCSKAVHSLVLTTFVSSRPEGHEAAHLDGNPANNRLLNLAWVTSFENKRHQRIHGTQPVGARHHKASLTEKDVAEIKELRGQGLLWKEIAKRFGVSKNTARSAGLGFTYVDCDKPQALVR